MSRRKSGRPAGRLQSSYRESNITESDLTEAACRTSRIYGGVGSGCNVGRGICVCGCGVSEAAAAGGAHALQSVLLAALRADHRSAEQLAREAGLSTTTIYRVRRGAGGLLLPAASRLAGALGLELVPVSRKGAPRGKK